MPSAFRALFPPIARDRLAFRGGLVALPFFVLLQLLYPLSLQHAEWVSTSAQFTRIALAAMLLGTLVGNSRLTRRSATALGSAVGTVLVLFLTIQASLPLGVSFGNGAVMLATKVNDWITQVAVGEAANDPTVFVLVLGATVWGAVFVGSFALARTGRPWEAILLSGACLVVNVSLALVPLTLDLVTFTLCALVLLVRFHIVSLEERWSRLEIAPSDNLSLGVLRGGVLWALVLVCLALATPRVGAADALSGALSGLEGPYRRAEVEWHRFFAGVSGPSRLKGVIFSDSVRLGQTPNLSDQVIMTVRSEQGSYWRAVAYDFYTGGGWRVTEDERVDKVTPLTAGRDKVDATFDVLAPNGALLFAANEPVRVDIPSQFQSGADKTFSVSIRAVNRFQAADPYTVTSYVSTANKATLRKATASYPDVVKQRYLQLPSTLPKRVRDLADVIVAGRSTAYDKAEEIETYLREHYRYTTNVKSPPAGRDPVDYFLFDLKEDYCEYFASAMIVMLRHVGVPARLVEGFTTGSLDPNIDRYVVREQDAHAWVEAYFPQYGWVEFEPTPSAQTFVRLEDPSLLGTIDPGEEEGTAATDQENDALANKDLLHGEGGTEGSSATGAQIDPRPPLVLAALLLLAVLASYARFELRFRGTSPVGAAWGKTRLLAGYAGLASHPWQTPYEYASAVATAVPTIATEVRDIAHAEVLERYAVGGATTIDRDRARGAWLRIRGRLVRHLPGRVLGSIRRF